MTTNTVNNNQVSRQAHEQLTLTYQLVNFAYRHLWRNLEQAVDADEPEEATRRQDLILAVQHHPLLALVADATPWGGFPPVGMLLAVTEVEDADLLRTQKQRRDHSLRTVPSFMARR